MFGPQLQHQDQEMGYKLGEQSYSTSYGDSGSPTIMSIRDLWTEIFHMEVKPLWEMHGSPNLTLGWAKYLQAGT
jgi:hypothetical protein